MPETSAHAPADQSPQENSRASAVGSLLQIAAIGLALASFLGACGSINLLFDLCAHFRGQYLVLAAVLAIVLWRMKSRGFAVLALAIVFHNAILIGPYYLPAKSAEKPAAKLSLVSFNVHTSNRRSAEVLEYLRRKDPDLILLIEVDNRWIRELAELQKTHPHSVISSSSDNFGIALFSKRPFVQHEVINLGPDQLGSIWAELDLDGQRIGFLGTHPLPPMLPRMFRSRNEQLQAVSDQVRKAQLPTIVAGDLNATPWCVGFRPLTHAGLRDTALGLGVQRTWNSKLPLLRIPIDHVLATREFITLKRSVGPACGSDHYAVEAELGLKPAVGSAR